MTIGFGLVIALMLINEIVFYNTARGSETTTPADRKAEVMNTGSQEINTVQQSCKLVGRLNEMA